MRFCAAVRDWVTYCSRETPTTVSELFSGTDDALFSRVLANKDHVLQPYLPDRPSTQYNLRAKTHNKELIVKTPHLTVIETISCGCCIRTFIDFFV